MRQTKTRRHHLPHTLHFTNINLNSDKSGARSGSSLDEGYFPSRHYVSLLRSRWVWTKAQLPQQMTDGSPWNQPSHMTAQISRSIWFNLCVLICAINKCGASDHFVHECVQQSGLKIFANAVSGIKNVNLAPKFFEKKKKKKKKMPQNNYNL